MPLAAAPPEDGEAVTTTADTNRDSKRPRTIVIPSRPALAPDVELVGELQGSGFAERQWLIRRGPRFIQVTELLYHIAAHADGTRTLDEIAERVTDETEWLVRKEDIARLLAVRLLPAGIVAPSATPTDGVLPPGSPGRGSPLVLGAKHTVLRARAIEPVASALQHLFAPPLLIPLLGLVALAHWWMYTEAGLTAAVIDALFTPGFLLILLALIVLGGVVHEFGHASALRYGGGHARGMGVGFYVMFPAFYTDATDGYRLGRWARVRTGLGGVYFHLLYGSALIGAALAFGAEFLLVAVLFVNLEVVRQFIPFVRLDGYWVLADLVGVPDFFSQLGPFLRSRFPGGRAVGTRLPRLKPWVQAAFGVYMLIAIPVLGFLLYRLLGRFPAIVTAVWDAIETQLRVLRVLAGGGDLLAFSTSLAHLLVLVVSALGIAYFVYSLTWKPARAAWSSPSRTRRFAGVAAVATLIAFTGTLWAPELPFAGGAVPLGVQTFRVTSRSHVQGPVDYPQAPPVGGNHAAVWQNCGFYSRPVRAENAVHSLEHGAVWVTYRPGLAPDEIAAVRRLAHGKTYVLASPFPGLRQPVVVSAWGRQLPLGSAHDARLERFIRAYRLSSKAPEPGGPCTGGKGRAR